MEGVLNGLAGSRGAALVSRATNNGTTMRYVPPCEGKIVNSGTEIRYFHCRHELSWSSGKIRYLGSAMSRETMGDNRIRHLSSFI